MLWQEAYPITEQFVLVFLFVCFILRMPRHHVTAITLPSIINHCAYMAASLPTTVSCPMLCHPSFSILALTEPHFSQQR